jgi:hypothetical protein
MKTQFGDDPTEPLLFAGYQSGSIEFANVFNDDNVTGPPLRDRLDALIEAAVTAESGILPGTFVSILVVGHADRVDAPGTTPEQRRALELQNSGFRAESALAFVFNRIADRMLQVVPEVPNDIASLQSVDMRMVAAGSADLIFTEPGNDEGQRMANRRVQFFGAAFTP